MTLNVTYPPASIHTPADLAQDRRYRNACVRSQVAYSALRVIRRAWMVESPDSLPHAWMVDGIHGAFIDLVNGIDW